MISRANSASADRERQLVTPEGVELGVVIAETGQRIGAFLLDTLLLVVFLIVMSLVAVLGFGSFGQRPGSQWVALIWLLGFFFLRNGYFIAMELRPRAATYGKRWLGVRVVARDGGRLTADAVVARNLMREIEVFVPLSLLAAGVVEGLAGWLGFAWAALFLLFPLTNRDRLRVGDLLAGTWVIRAHRPRLVVDLAAGAPVDDHRFTPAQLDAYGIYELETLEAVLRQPDRRARDTVAKAIAQRIGWTAEIADVDGFLGAYYAQLRARLEARLVMGKRRTDKFDV